MPISDLFKLYTEDARRTIQFAEYEAAEFGSAEVGTEHVLLGLLTDANLDNQVVPNVFVPEIRDEIIAHLEHKTTQLPSEEIPIGGDTKKVLVLARKEAESLSRRYVSNYHILLGLLQLEDCLPSRVLRLRGLSVRHIRDQISTLKEDAQGEYALRAAPTGAEDENLRAGGVLDDLELLTMELALLDDYQGALRLVDTAIDDPRLDRNKTILRLAKIASAIARTIRDVDAAKRYYELWVTCDPNYALAFYGLACCLKEQGKTEEANETARKSYHLSVTQGGTIGRGLAETIEKQFPGIGSDA